MIRYSQERKESVLKKLLPPLNKTVAEVAKEEGISEATLYNWRNKIRDSGKPVPGKSATNNQWSAEAKLAFIIETSSLSETEISQYCREKGLYPEQITQWKQECLQGFEQQKEQERRIKQKAKSDQAEIKSLKKELRKKEKALAEAAALLVLRKKLKALYGEGSEDD